jgi:hypothetical protein
MSEIASKYAKLEHAVRAEPTSDCRIGDELDNAAAHQELEGPPAKINIPGAAIEKIYTPSPQRCDGNDPTITGDPVGFLDTFFGKKPWPLMAIRKVPKDVQAETFMAAADREKSAADWVLSSTPAATTSTSR